MQGSARRRPRDRGFRATVDGRSAAWSCALVAALAATGCGGPASVDFASPQVITVGSTELDGRGRIGFRLRIASLRLTRTRWFVSATVANATPVTWVVSRPHVPDGTKFGLFVFDAAGARLQARMDAGRTTPPLLADRFEPRLPDLLRPGQEWRGTFSGPGRIPRGRYVRFAFGRFTTTQPPPAGLPARLLAVTRTPVSIR